MAKCQICGRYSSLISAGLGLCLECIRSKPKDALQVSSKIHERTRRAFSLPGNPPRSPEGLQCGQCANECSIDEGQRGYCGLVENRSGNLRRHGGTPQSGVLQWYYDALPTNCVSWWFCPGCTGAGYPKYAHNAREAEWGFSNLAVFYGSCSTDCLFCQNWHHRKFAQNREPTISAEQLASKVNKKTSCICFFGGDPSTQMPHALETSRIALQKASDRDRILRICWETNGQMLSVYAQQAAKLSLETGGNIKFDIKAWSEDLVRVLCGTPNAATLENFKRIGEEHYGQRPELPLLSASTLLVPGYVDSQEIENISRFIAEVNPQIPYTLLAFYPAYMLTDLPTTDREYALNCHKTARKHLENVKIGNANLLA